MSKDNKTLGVFHLDGIAPAPRGIPQIEVTFDIDANGIVHVSAKDLGTGKEQNITITASTNLSQEEIDKAVKEAEQYAAEDKKRREEIDTRNAADQMVYQSEKLLADIGEKLPDVDKAPVKEQTEVLKQALKGTDTAKIKEASDELTKRFYDLSGKLYSQPGAQGGPGAAGPQGPQAGGPQAGAGPDNGGAQYYDADYEVKDDDQNK